MSKCIIEMHALRTSNFLALNINRFAYPRNTVPILLLKSNFKILACVQIKLFNCTVPQQLGYFPGEMAKQSY